MKEQDFENQNLAENEPRADVIVGRNPVMEALKSGREADKLMVAHGAAIGSTKAIIAKCREKGILVKEVAPQKLDFLSGGAAHQGVALIVAAHKYCTVEDILDFARERKEPPFVVICDGIEDPHNLGAIIRSAEATGVHGIIIPERRSASINAVVQKASAGACAYMKVARVTNISTTIETLKKAGLWIYAADMDGETWCSADLKGAAGLVIGSEGRGVGRLVKETCDKIVSMPMNGQINSLNASVAAGVLMYEFARQRAGIKAFNG